MVKEIPQPSKYQCEHCDRVYTKLGNAQKCESRGLPEFKYNIGDEVETIIQLTNISRHRVNEAPMRLFDIGGEFARVKVTDRYYWNHKPFYTFEHPQIQGQYWRYPELAFELPDELTESLKESIPGGPIVIQGDSPGSLKMEFDEKAMKFEIVWRGFRDYLWEHGTTNTHHPKINAEPINPK